MTRRLVREFILPRLDNEYLAPLGDAAHLPPLSGPLAFTSDSSIVTPLFFPGGDIGSLAVYGTVNDLVVAGARPRWLTLNLILEEGLPLEVLGRVLDSVAAAAQATRVIVAAGDTKVAPRGAVDGLFLSVAGVGELLLPTPPGAAALQPGDECVISGPIGEHGVAILAARENLGFEPPPASDCRPLLAVTERLRERSLPIRCMRDATRGGVAAVLQEWSDSCGHTLTIDEAGLPVRSHVRAACELLGLDPLHLACEGAMVVATPAGNGAALVEALRDLPEGAEAALVGEVRPRGIAKVTIRRALGVEQPLDEPLGAPLPRIC